MYLRHFAFTRLPFETPAETDELFESSARREAEAKARPPHRVARHRPAHRRGGVRQDHCLPTPHRSAPPGPLPRSTTSRLPQATCSTCTNRSHGRSVSPSSDPAPRPTTRSGPRSPASQRRPSNCPSSSSTRPTTCATTSSKTSACSPTSPWMRSSACASSSSASPSSGGDCPWPCTSPSASQRLVVRHHLHRPRSKGGRRLSRAPPPPRGMRTAPVRGPRRRGPVPGRKGLAPVQRHRT